MTYEERKENNILLIDHNSDGMRLIIFFLKTLKGLPKGNLFDDQKGRGSNQLKKSKANDSAKTDDLIRIPPHLVPGNPKEKNPTKAMDFELDR